MLMWALPNFQFVQSMPILTRLAEQQKAIAALPQGEAADPDDSAILYAHATIHAQLGQNQKAIAAAALALELRSDFPDATQLMQALSRPSR